MQKVTKAHTAAIIQILQADIARYVTLTNTRYNFSNQQDDYVTQLQFNDVVYVYNALVQFTQTKNVTQLCNTLLAQETQPREWFYNVVHYATDNYLYV
jgi:hypothetical protein